MMSFRSKGEGDWRVVTRELEKSPDIEKKEEAWFFHNNDNYYQYIIEI